MDRERRRELRRMAQAVRGLEPPEPISQELQAELEWDRLEAAHTARKHMLFGVLWMIGGAAVTLTTYLAASGGGYFYIFTGAILWGVIDFTRGLIVWLANRNGG